ncbi:dipeptide/oligopeptide/nickel ABC transporter permease/ATP-binding protein [Dactylosporangium siamense]|uniref:Peptide ABC transporter ATP-binding protein n=1 Tax=Dactylosporangium siamense TaxID=685454 RepID=A0A919UEJ2_9ACTN|nr:dipeptide/oligopeptide/nickel ABC transporter permease/ATP-binding protein [Dactylosporangium siamense]GIG52509.1 peptide ABC transporter ATP-binding protein [Dactylosporangium siamense]
MQRWSRAARTPLGIVGFGLLAVTLFLAVFAPLIWHRQAGDYDTDNLLAGASGEHWFGTDNLGRDIFYRVLVATRLSITLAVSATLIAVVVGVVLGAAPTLLGRWIGRPLIGLVNILVAFPGLLLVLFFAIVFGVGAKGAVLAVGLAGAPTFARLGHTLMAAVAGRDFVAAARASGVRPGRILVRHLLPNIAEPLIVNATIGAGGVLLSFAGLSFLGLGVQSPDYDWGRMMQDGLGGIYVHPLAALAPGAAVIIAGLAFNLSGEAVARALGVQVDVAWRAVVTPTRHRARAAAPPPADDVDPDLVLDVANLRVAFPHGGDVIRPVRGVTFQVRRGEAVGIVGESGSGKSLTALAVADLLEFPAQVDADRLAVLGTDLHDGTDHRHLLGTSVAMVFQDPMTSFNPAHRVGAQLAEAARAHQGATRKQAWRRAVDRLSAVHIHDPHRRARQYPFEFSGGMRQRAMIGMGLMGAPKLIVADEPTTALDVTVQRQVLDMLREVRTTDDVALILISHDVSVVAEVCDRVMVMYAGRVVEDLPAADLAVAARHPYTRALVAAVPDMHSDLDAPLATIFGQPVDPAHVPDGCAYAARCPLADRRCRTQEPTLTSGVACWHPGESLPVPHARDAREVDA